MKISNETLWKYLEKRKAQTTAPEIQQEELQVPTYSTLEIDQEAIPLQNYPTFPKEGNRVIVISLRPFVEARS
ncbi:unnamed protein product [Dimorphilus gyrociliatus]|uniref:Uncharacterized protein n=1 Tax=Dimorphilus gyrociliatus TaxID=2664684 RepID=A0A7I8WF06_9ANNE|nr:unnamed protein product [Dimorphilus gyrociliatus]